MKFYEKLKKTLNTIFPSELLKEDVELRQIATSSEDEILKIAQSIYGHSSDNISQMISLNLNKEKLVWRVRFALADGSKSGHTILIIDDKTKELVERFDAPF